MLLPLLTGREQRPLFKSPPRAWIHEAVRSVIYTFLSILNLRLAFAVSKGEAIRWGLPTPIRATKE